MVPYLDGVQSAKQPLKPRFQRFHLPNSGEEQGTRNETSAGERASCSGYPSYRPQPFFAQQRKRRSEGTPTLSMLNTIPLSNCRAMVHRQVACMKIDRSTLETRPVRTARKAVNREGLLLHDVGLSYTTLRSRSKRKLSSACRDALRTGSETRYTALDCGRGG